ncbi:MAG: hypothetical protein HKN13_06130 [Rhodothermales bacterium]|nr:hypothetical protein [Rhodothermales bacterium]
MNVSKYSVVLAVVFSIAVLATESVEAQSRWQQTVQAITPVRAEHITGSLLDSLIAVSQRSDVRLRRSPDDATEHSIAELEEILLDEGLDVTSANQMFVTYRYEADQRSFKTDILELYFIYRPVEYEDADTPIAIIDATQPVVRNLLVSNGTALASNEAVFEPFWDQLRLHQLEDGTVVKVGSKIIRDEDEAATEKAKILTIIRRFLY